MLSTPPLQQPNPTHVRANAGSCDGAAVVRLNATSAFAAERQVVGPTRIACTGFVPLLEEYVPRSAASSSSVTCTYACARYVAAHRRR